MCMVFLYVRLKSLLHLATQAVIAAIAANATATCFYSRQIDRCTTTQSSLKLWGTPCTLASTCTAGSLFL